MKSKFTRKALSLLLSAAFVLSMSVSSVPVMATETAETELSTEMPAESTPIEETYFTETAPVVEAANYDVYTVNTALYMRAKADKTSTALTILPEGATIYVQEETKISNGDLWGKTDYTKNGTKYTGWLSLKYCTKRSTGTATKHVGDTTTTTIATTTTTTEATTTTTTEAVTTTTTKAEVTESTTVTTTEAAGVTTTDFWNPVDTTEDPTTTTTDATTETTAAPVTYKTYQYKVTASSLNVRKGAGTSYDTIGSLNNGTVVTVTEISSNNWGKINYNGQTGWISLSYAQKISEKVETVTTTTESVTTTTEGVTTTTSEGQTTTTTEGTAATTQAASSSKTYIVTASSLNLRSGPDTTYSVLTQLPNGAEVTVTEVSSNNWGKTTYNGQTGWISLAYCTETSSATVDPAAGGWQNVSGTWVYYSNGTKLFSSNAMHTAWTKIANLASGTSYYIVVNCSTCQLFMFKGSKGNWVPYKLWSCSPGASSTPTVKGTFTVSSRGYSFGTYGSYTCYYWTQFYGNYLFHSVLYYWNSSTIKDGRLGMNLSHGCVRLAIDNAKFIYNNVPNGTKVLVY